MKNNKPKQFLFFKILGFCSLIVAVTGIALTVVGIGDFESNNFMIGGALTAVGFVLAPICFIFGFQPEIHKMLVKSTKYIQSENKDDLKDIALTTADITSEAVTTTAKAVKEGLSDTKYCKHCGEKIDADSKFCSKCGKEQ